MERNLLLMILLFGIFSMKAQSCEEIMEYVKSKDYGVTYTSYDSDAISKVTFYSIMVDYQTYYFAIVCFKRQYSYDCSEYIYRVASDTKLNYAMNYIDSAGKAFWKYIQPYNKVLGCGANLE